MRLTLYLLPLTLSVACSGTTITTDDTANPDDTDTDSGLDSVPELPTDFTFFLEGDYEGSSLTLTWIDFASLNTGSPVLGEPHAFGAVESDAVDVAFGIPDTADLQEIDPETAPGLLLAGYIPGLHLDSDGDGQLSDGETYVGVGVSWPIYITGDIPPEYIDYGMVEGWNALDLTTPEGQPATDDITGIPLDAALGERTSVTFGGSFIGADDPGIVMVPFTAFEGGSVDELIYDGPLDDPWSVTLDQIPPEDHFEELEGLGTAALEVPIAYSDTNRSGGYNDGDTPLYPACHDGLSVGLLYLPAITDLLTGWSLTIQGVGAGWLAITLGDENGGAVLTEEQLQSLAIDGSCML